MLPQKGREVEVPVQRGVTNAYVENEFDRIDRRPYRPESESVKALGLELEDLLPTIGETRRIQKPSKQDEQRFEEFLFELDDGDASRDGGLNDYGHQIARHSVWRDQPFNDVEVGNKNPALLDDVYQQLLGERGRAEQDLAPGPVSKLADSMKTRFIEPVRKLKHTAETVEGANSMLDSINRLIRKR